MEIELFSIKNKLDADNGFRKECVGIKLEIAKIAGKQLVVSVLNKNLFKPDYNNFYSKYPFTCKFDIPYEVEVELYNGKKRNLNTEIIYTEYTDGGDDLEHKAYAYLTWVQRINEKLKRKQLWIQQSSNIMWIVNVLVAILAILAAISTVK